jgi:hypothetical protein
MEPSILPTRDSDRDLESFQSQGLKQTARNPVITIEQVRNAMRNAPFTVRLVDGSSFRVEHRDFISVPAIPRGRYVTINEGKHSHEVDILLIQSLDFEEREVEPGPSAGSNGPQPPDAA